MIRLKCKIEKLFEKIFLQIIDKEGTSKYHLNHLFRSSIITSDIFCGFMVHIFFTIISVRLFLSKINVFKYI
jgi:hypothetical protein